MQTFFSVAAALFVCGLGNAHEHKTQTRKMPFASVALHREAPQDVPRPAILATHKSTIHQAASSSSCSAQTSKQGPLYPTLRANPFPKVTDLCCRLPLPTLYHRPEAANLGDLMRLWVRSGVQISSHSVFHERVNASQTSRKTKCFTRQ